MTNEEILVKMAECKKGTYVKLTKVKDLGCGCQKVTDMVIRLGIDYYNMKENEGKPRQGLKWGHYVEGLEGYVIEHKGNYYLRIYDNGTNIDAKSKYFQNGIEKTKEAILAIVGENPLKSAYSSCYNVKFENIIRLGR